MCGLSYACHIYTMSDCEDLRTKFSSNAHNVELLCHDFSLILHVDLNVLVFTLRLVLVAMLQNGCRFITHSEVQIGRSHNQVLSRPFAATIDKGKSRVTKLLLQSNLYVYRKLNNNVLFTFKKHLAAKLPFSCDLFR